MFNRYRPAWALGLAVLAAGSPGQAQDMAAAKKAFLEVLAGADFKAKQAALTPLLKDWNAAATYLGELRSKVAKLAGSGKAGEASPEAVKSATKVVFGTLAGQADATDAAAKMASSSALKTAATGIARAIDTWRKNLVAGLIGSGMSSGARFAGQYAALAKLGDDAGQLVLDMVENPPQRVSDPMRGALLAAYRDVTTKMSEKDKKRIDEIATDDFEDEGVMAMAMYVLYQFGHKELLDKRITEMQKIAKTEGQELTGNQQLADVWWNVREYGKAVEAYRSAIAHASALPAAARSVMYYNMCCSQSLGKDIDGALESLDKALELAKGSSNLSDQLLRVDRDIANLRTDPRFAKLLAKHGRQIKIEKKAPASRKADRGDAGK